MSAPASTVPVNLLGLDQQGLRQWLAGLGEKPFRASQMMKWLYHAGVTDFSAMTDLSKALRAKLATGVDVRTPEILFEGMSQDGTLKWLLQLDGGNAIETVYIPEGNRGTLCVSTQVGCALDCSFCATARQGFNRNLSSAEIIGQLWVANTRLAAREDTQGQRITNVVIMGMGEPLANFANLVPALNIMIDDLAYGLSKRRVTVSTSGIVPAMDRLKDAVDVALAVSLHAPNDALRDQLVPINKKYPLASLMDACWRWVDKDRKTHVMFEYVMLAGVNDQPEHARQLVRLLGDLPSKVNLIPFNPFPGVGYTRSSNAAINRFWDVLNHAGVRTTKRRTRGDDIDAACGQLAGQVQDKSRRPEKFALPRFGEGLGEDLNQQSHQGAQS